MSKRNNEKPAKERLYPPPGMSTQKCINLINRLGRIRWHADIEKPYDHANGVFKYVGRYIRRGPISERRIQEYDGKVVKIAYAHPDKHEKPHFSISAQTFVHRLLLSHVPEKASHVVRPLGLFHPNCRAKSFRSTTYQGGFIKKTQKVPDRKLLIVFCF